MTIALPTHVVDAVSSAASTGMEMASSMLHDATRAAEAAAGATSGRARRLLRTSRRNLPRRSSGRSGRRLLGLAALSAAILIALAFRRSTFDSRQARVRPEHDGATPAPFAHERNEPVTSRQTDDIKGRVKEAAGAITDNDGLKREGKKDQAASTAKGVVDKAGDKIEQGIDAVKDKLKKN